MNRQPLSPAQSEIARVLGPLDGARIVGGCDHCDAYQTVVAVTAGVWQVVVHHDHWCPMLKREASHA